MVCQNSKKFEPLLHDFHVQHFRRNVKKNCLQNGALVTSKIHDQDFSDR